MTLGRVIDAVVEHLRAELGPDVGIGDVFPVAVAELPVVALAIGEAERQLIGIGTVPRGTQSGALALDVTIDLANPVLAFGGGETLLLLSADRRIITLPHGPLVRRDGTQQQPFGADDVVVNDPNPFVVVGGPPVGRQVAVDADLGELRFGVAFPATGEVRVAYHVGQWDTVVTRFQGVLDVDVLGVDAASTGQLSREVAAAIDRVDMAIRLVPIAWRRIEAMTIGSGVGRRQLLQYRFDAELEDPLVPSSGGVISRIAAAIDLPDPLNQSPDEIFDVR